MSTIRVYVDLDDVIEEIDTDDLISELETRNDLPPRYKAIADSDKIDYSKTPKRDALINLFDLGTGASLEEILEEVKLNYYK